MLRFVLVSALLCPFLSVSAADKILDTSAALSVDALGQRVGDKRVVFVGETHDRYDHHATELEIIRRLYQADNRFVIGVEFLQQPFQSKVDDYIAGRIDETQFLRETEYFERWGYDYRMYAPILRFAREQHIPVRALNVPSALSTAVARVGVTGLSEDQRTYLPRQMEPADDAYKARLRKAFEAHGPTKPGEFDRFVEAQLVWDEGMAESASTYLMAHPGSRMVVIAGSGHLEFGSGIPQRLKRRTNASYAIVLNMGDQVEPPEAADYLVFSSRAELPPAGKLGVRVEARNGAVRIRSLDLSSAGAMAGLRKGDILVQIDGQPVKGTGDVSVALWDKKPQDQASVEVRRKRLFQATETRSFTVRLGTVPQPVPQ